MKEAGRQSPTRKFELVGGHPALDLVNTLDWRFRETGREELLRDYGDLVQFVEQSDLIDAAEARGLISSVPESKGERVLAAVRELREAAAEVFYAALDGNEPATSAIRRLQDRAKEAKQQQQMRWCGSNLVWELPQTATVALPLWLLSLRVEEFVTSDRMSLLRQCDSPECRWLFMDTSKNHTRRWCDMKICGNRMKARRFKAQHGSLRSSR